MHRLHQHSSVNRCQKPADNVMNVVNPRPKCEVNSFIEWIMGLDQWARGCNHTPLPSKHMLQMSKESTALFLRWESQTPLKKKSTLARDARSATRVFSNQRHPAWLQSFPFFSAEPCLREGSVRWVRAELGSAVVVLVHNLIQCVGSSR